jgi:hypothetical protein
VLVLQDPSTFGRDLFFGGLAMSVYFIRAGDYIKIGVASDPHRRLREHQTSSPQKLELVGVIEGGRELERALHAMFSDAHVNGEWFKPTAKMLAIAQGTITVSAPSQPKDSNEWIEFSKKGTRNPKRYAYLRRWVKRGEAWVKSKPVRIKTIKPMSEEEYRAYKLGTGIHEV